MPDRKVVLVTDQGPDKYCGLQAPSPGEFVFGIHRRSRPSRRSQPPNWLGQLLPTDRKFRFRAQLPVFFQSTFRIPATRVTRPGEAHGAVESV